MGVAQRAELEARVAEQARQLEAFQRQEAERARAAAPAAVAAAALPSAPQQPPSALALQAEVPRLPAVSEAAQQLSLQPSVWGSGSYLPQQLPVTVHTVAGFPPGFQPVLQQQPQQLQSMIHGRGLSAAQPARDLRPGSDGHGIAARQSPQMQYHGTGYPAVDWDGRGIHGAGAVAEHGQQQRQLQSGVASVPRLQWDGAGGGGGLAAAAPRWDLRESTMPAQDAAASHWNDLPPQQPQPPSNDGMQQLQALMAAMPQFAGLAARLDKVGAHSRPLSRQPAHCADPPQQICTIAPSLTNTAAYNAVTPAALTYADLWWQRSGRNCS